MKLFTQLALVSAIAVSGNAMAMQALDDAQLASTTGQDGITLTIKPPVKAFSGLTAGAGGVIAIDHIYVHDKDGLAIADGGTGTAGAITLDGFAIAGNQPIVVKIDADGGGAAAGGAFLNVNVALPSEPFYRCSVNCTRYQWYKHQNFGHHRRKTRWCSHEHPVG